MAEISADDPLTGTVDTGRMLTYAGGVLSLALIAGIGVWGGRLVMRDVSGIPMVQAIDGPMRVAASDPGGQIAEHTGLAVNAVAGQGSAAPAEDSVTLAPADQAIPSQDMTVTPRARDADVITISAPGPAPAATTAPPPLQMLGEDEVQQMVDDILAGADASPLSAPEEAPAEASAPATPGADDPTMTTVIVNGVEVATHRRISPLAVAQAPRPKGRRGARVSQASAPAPAAAPETTAAVTAPATATASETPLAVGAALAQLGAYDSEPVAATEWARFLGLFPDLMADLQPVVQRAESGQRVFYRLRAGGFADISAAKRFCAALEAQRVDCIPVVNR